MTITQFTTDVFEGARVRQSVHRVTGLTVRDARTVAQSLPKHTVATNAGQLPARSHRLHRPQSP